MLTVGFASGDCGHHSMSCWDTLRACPLCAGSISPWDDWLPTSVTLFAHPPCISPGGNSSAPKWTQGGPFAYPWEPSSSFHWLIFSFEHLPNSLPIIPCCVLGYDTL